MRRVERQEIVDYQTYEDVRAAFREKVMREKAARRVHVGSHLTFLFENRETIRYQVQEMVRAERIVREAEIRHELDTYNELLGGTGQLGCTLMIEIDDAAERAVLLARWLHLPRHVYLRLPDGGRVYAGYDQRQVGETRLSAVQYLKFDTRGRVPVAAGADHPELTVETALSEEQRAALAADLAD